MRRESDETRIRLADGDKVLCRQEMRFEYSCYFNFINSFLEFSSTNLKTINQAL